MAHRLRCDYLFHTFKFIIIFLIYVMFCAWVLTCLSNNLFDSGEQHLRRVFQKLSEATAGNKLHKVVQRLITELPRVAASLEYVTAFDFFFFFLCF